MVFSEIFIRKPIMTILVMMAALIFGVAAYTKLPISDLPSVDYPVMTITVVYPGASPATMASTVASPLENECMQIPGLQTVLSNNTEGQTLITLTFDLDRNVDLAAPDVEAAISRATSNLPGDLPQPPSYSKNNPSDSPILYIMVTSDTMRPGELYDFGNRTVGQRISMIQGVSQVSVWGAKTAVRIQVDPDKLAAFKIGLDEVKNALTSGTVTIPGGSLNGQVHTFSLEPKGQLLNAKDYDELIVTYRDNAPVRLKDIGICVDSLQNDVVNVMYGSGKGKEMRSGTVCVSVYRRSGANTVALSQRIRDTVKDLKREIPGSVDLDIFYDRAVAIIESVNDVKNTVIIALILVVLVIFLFIGRISDTVIPSITLPFTLFATFIFMFAAGFSLDNLSLMGLTLSVGFLVDDAIVVLENTVRHVEAGEKPLKAAILSMQEITGIVISTSVALITVFVPLVFMSGVVGRNFNEFALTVVAAIIASMIMALTLSPMMCARMLKTKKKTATKMEMFTDSFVGNLSRKYSVLLKWVLKHRIVSVLLWIACFLGTLALFVILPKTFLPEGDSGAIQGQLLVPQGTSTEQVRKFQDQIDAVFQSDPAVEKVISATGLQPGADQSTGPVFAVLTPLKQRDSIQKVVQRLRVKLAAIPLGFVFIEAIPSLNISTGGESTAAGSKYSYALNGSDREKVYECALKLEKGMKAMPSLVDIQNSVKLNMPQLNITILRDRASALGVTAADIENALSLAYAGGKITTYKTDIDQYYVILELKKKYSRNTEDLSTIYIRSSSTGKLVPLGSVATWSEGVGPQNVPHYDQLNSATISFNVKAGVPLGNVTKDLTKLAGEILPPGISGTFQGEAQEFEEAVASLSVLIVVAVIIMYIILGILYESYIHPLTVLTTLPVAAFGGLATLLFFRSELSLYAYIGMFMLLGIVSKNGIMMVDFATQNLEEKNVTNYDAIYNACLVRFRPILMTGASTIIGAVPIALGFGADGASRRPLGLIVVGGLIFAQVITLVVTPGIFLYMQDFQDKFLNRFDLSRSGSARKTADEELF
ncbi:MAG: efflux RND transporter permease subunit [Candidatus Omnitrophota bacterium]